MANAYISFITPPFRASFVNLLEPGSFGKYGMSVPLKKDTPMSHPEVQGGKTLPAEDFIPALIDAVCVKQFGTDDKKKWPKMKSYVSDGDNDPPSNTGEEYENTIYFSANSQKPVGVINARKKPIPEEDWDEEVYSGMVCRVSLNAYYFITRGEGGAVKSQGIAFGLNGVQKLGDADRYDGRKPVEDQFDNDVPEEYLKEYEERQEDEGIF
jgi:hypothetical protein